MDASTKRQLRKTRRVLWRQYRQELKWGLNALASHHRHLIDNIEAKLQNES